MSERAQKLHASAHQGVFYVTGGGSQLLAELLGTPGASGTVLEGHIPYSPIALADLLGQTPRQAASSSTARLLAMAAFERAQALGGSSCFGLGLTAALATNRDRRGEDRAHWAIQTPTTTYTFNARYAGDRDSEEALLLEQLWASLNHCLLDADWSVSGVDYEHHPAPDEWHELLGANPHSWCSGHHDGKLLLPGSFNPIHAGHTEMLVVAETRTGLQGAYELCVKNADKPSLDYLTIAERVMQFDSHPIWLTNLPTYAEKARHFPGTAFALGVDTVARIAEPRFYNDSERSRDAAVAALVDNDASLLVFGRTDGGRFVTLDDLDLPMSLREICTAIPEAEYRNDLSSTALRNQ